MKVGLIYFSQTGNTEKCAVAIKKGVDETRGKEDFCDLLKMKDVNPRHLFERDFDLIGIGSPTWGGATPTTIAFINDLIGVGGTPCFFFYTHGTLGESFPAIIVPMLKDKGLLVIGWKGWPGDHPQMWSSWPYPTAGHPDEQDLREAEEFGKEMVDRCRRIKAGEINLIPSDPEMPDIHPGEPVTAVWKPFEFPGARKYHRGKCLYPKCRLCMENCYMYDIDLSVEPRRVDCHDEHGCTLCAMICPTGAIEMDDYLKSQIPNYFKIEAEDSFALLKKAESQGKKLRRLVPEDKVGSEGAFCEVYTGHPKWIIKQNRPGKKITGGPKTPFPCTDEK